MPTNDPIDVPDDAPITKTVATTVSKIIEGLPAGAQDFIDNNLRGPFEGVLDSIVELERQIANIRSNGGDAKPGSDSESSS